MSRMESQRMNWLQRNMPKQGEAEIFVCFGLRERVAEDTVVLRSIFTPLPTSEFVLAF